MEGIDGDAEWRYFVLGEGIGSAAGIRVVAANSDRAQADRRVVRHQNRYKFAQKRLRVDAYQ